MPVAVKDIVAHVASQETPARSIDAYTRSVADAVGSLQTRADVACLARDLLANIGPMNAAIAHDPRIAGSVAPVGVAPAIVAPLGGRRHPAAAGAATAGADGPGPADEDVPGAFAEIHAEIAALGAKVDALASVVSANMPLAPVASGDLGAPAGQRGHFVPPNGPVDSGS